MAAVDTETPGTDAPLHRRALTAAPTRAVSRYMGMSVASYMKRSSLDAAAIAGELGVNLIRWPGGLAANVVVHPRSYLAAFPLWAPLYPKLNLDFEGVVELSRDTGARPRRVGTTVLAARWQRVPTVSPCRIPRTHTAARAWTGRCVPPDQRSSRHAP